MENIKLTIAIPTYNRCELLKQTLDSVLKQNRDDIEIIVSDNASNDGTFELIKKYQHIKNFRYVYNKTNLGMDRNFLNCIQQSRGEYLEFLSDDDILLPGAVDKVISYIDDYSPDYINLNSFTYSEEKFDENCIKPARIKLGQDLITEDKSVYVQILGVYLTYISATIVKMKDFKNIKNMERYVGTYFLHAHLVLESLKNANAKVIITKEPYLAAKNNNSGGFDLYEVWIKQYKNLLLGTAVNNGFNKTQMKKIYVNDVNGFIKDSIIKYRVTDNKYEMKKVKILFDYTYNYPSIILKTWIYALMPRIILEKIYWHRRKNRIKK